MNCTAPKLTPQTRHAGQTSRIPRQPTCAATSQKGTMSEKMVGFHLTIFSLIVPFWLVAAQVGWRGMREVWPACLVCGVSFGAVQFIVSNFYGPALVDI